MNKKKKLKRYYDKKLNVTQNGTNKTDIEDQPSL